MPIPGFTELKSPLLALTADGSEHTLRDAMNSLAVQFRVTGPERAELLPSGRQQRFRHRVSWATTDLVMAGLLQRVGRARFRITDRGSEVLDSHPEAVDRKYLSRFPEFRAFLKRTRAAVVGPAEGTVAPSVPPPVIGPEGTESMSSTSPGNSISDPPPVAGDNSTDEGEVPAESDFGHTRAQWCLARMAVALGLKVWIPRADRQKAIDGEPLGDLSVSSLPPMGFSPQASRIVENIDVLWLNNGMVVCAFEVEHSTVIYSGLLRLSDLLSVAPNTRIRLFVVAGQERRARVARELSRPTFSQLHLIQHCKYVSYDRLEEQFLFAKTHAGYLSWETWIDQRLAESLAEDP